MRSSGPPWNWLGFIMAFCTFVLMLWYAFNYLWFLLPAG